MKGRQTDVLANAQDNSFTEEQTVVGEGWKRHTGGRDRTMSEGQPDTGERQTGEVCDMQIGGTGEKQTSGAEGGIEQQFAVLPKIIAEAANRRKTLEGRLAGREVGALPLS